MALHRELADELRRQILAGERELGEALPSEARLCAEWGTSRGPVRQALTTLRAEGLIGGGRGSPPVVRSRQLSQPFETFMSFTRWALTTGCLPGQRTISVVRCPAPATIADALGIDLGETVVVVLRLRLLDGEPAMLERAHFPLEVGLPLLIADLDRNSIYDTLLTAGISPHGAHHVIDAVGADDDDAAFLGVGIGTPLLRERRTSINSAGETVEFAEDRYRSDLITFTVANTQATPPALARTWSPHVRNAS